MTLSIWRYAHLVLALVSSVFLLILSVTGVILAYDAVESNSDRYRRADLAEISVAQTVQVVKQLYPEIFELSVDRQSRVYLDAMDEDSEPVQGYIDPETGELLGSVAQKSAFMQWTTTLHRSLFLHETGRILVGVVSFLLLLITVTGILLIVKRQQGWKRFFNKVHRDFLAQYFHVVSGRLMLLPVLMIALTGTYLFLVRTGIVAKPEIKQAYTPTDDVDDEGVAPMDFPIFQQTLLSEVERLEFPFMEDDPEEFFILTIKDRQVTINQLNGEVVEETRYAYTAVWEKLSLDLHTGQTNRVWAVILGLGALNILFFIYSGFVITFRRTRTKIKNSYTPTNAEVIVLFASENGSTLAMASRVHQQLLDQGKRALLQGMDQYTMYPQAKELILFVATYGLGDAPNNSKRFLERVLQVPQQQAVHYAVLGFGSRAYPDFCAYAGQVDSLLSAQSWAKERLSLHTVSDKSAADIAAWAQAWSKETLITLATADAVYAAEPPKLQVLRVVAKTAASEDDPVFRVCLKPVKRTKFRSGDLLAIYPNQDAQERFYSIGRVAGQLQLIVKLHPHGLGSEFLHRLKEGEVLMGRLLPNAHFHLPKQAKGVAMIANGTGIAPFLGMLDGNKNRQPIRLYAGFRHKSRSNEDYAAFAQKEIARGRLSAYHVAYSREGAKQYVLHLIERDADYFAALLHGGGVVMICGALQMQRDVEGILKVILRKRSMKELAYYRDRGQWLTDCY